jgi:hypothetical protein
MDTGLIASSLEHTVCSVADQIRKLTVLDANSQIRSYQDDPVEQKQLDEILRLARDYNHGCSQGLSASTGLRELTLNLHAPLSCTGYFYETLRSRWPSQVCLRFQSMPT